MKKVITLAMLLTVGLVQAGDLKRAPWADSGNSYGYTCNGKHFTVSSGSGSVSVTGLGSCDRVNSNTDVHTEAYAACNCYSN